jgi:DNA-binding CsgD family transcriptional regulator
LHDIQTALDSFREAAILPDRWPHALDLLARACDSDGATLVLETTALDSVAASTSVQPFVAEYLASPVSDPREQRCRPRTHEGFMPDQAYFSATEIASDPYYQEFLSPRGFGWNAVAALHGDLMVSVKRGFGRAAYDGADLQALNEMLPWLRSVSRAASMTWHSGFVGQLNAFERMGRGAILVDRCGRVLDANACVTFGDGLDVRSGVLRLSHSGGRTSLQGFLAGVLAVGELRSLSQSTTLSVPRPSGLRPWLLDGVACTDAIRSLHSRAAALVLVTDLERKNQPTREALRELFGLTPMECELARELVVGSSLQDCALHLAISEGHARQRLQAIFCKTGTARQGELIALLAKLA